MHSDIKPKGSEQRIALAGVSSFNSLYISNMPTRNYSQGDFVKECSSSRTGGRAGVHFGSRVNAHKFRVVLDEYNFDNFIFKKSPVEEIHVKCLELIRVLEKRVVVRVCDLLSVESPCLGLVAASASTFHLMQRHRDSH